jgi:methylmalonyl-CoA decarboxylase subunit alpha
MGMKELADDLQARRRRALAMGGAEAVAKQHAEGKLTVRERVDRLFDPGSFHEIGLLASHGNISPP